MVDDLVDTAAPCARRKALKDHGAERVVAYCTILCYRAGRG